MSILQHIPSIQPRRVDLTMTAYFLSISHLLIYSSWVIYLYFPPKEQGYRRPQGLFSHIFKTITFVLKIHFITQVINTYKDASNSIFIIDPKKEPQHE